MAGELTKIVTNLKQLPFFLKNQLKLSIVQNLDKVENMQRQRLEDGEATDGKPIKYQGKRSAPTNSFGTYNLKYSNYKESQGGVVKQVDLKLTSEWHNSIKAKLKGDDTIAISAPNNKKSTFIYSFYNNTILRGGDSDVLGLAPDQQEEVADTVAEDLADLIVNQFK